LLTGKPIDSQETFANLLAREFSRQKVFWLF